MTVPTPDAAAPVTVRRALLWCAVFALAVLVVRLYYVETYAIALPFFDQWDSEGDALLKPWIEGTLALQDLWSPRNEHRILPTRLFVLGLYEATGGWNNLDAARINTLLVAAFGGLLAYVLVRRGELRGARWLVPAVLLACLVLPFAWENFLVGYQSQFYVLQLLALVVLLLAASRPQDPRALALVLALAIVGCLTMASGLLTAVAAAAVLQVDAWNRRERSVRCVIATVLLVAIALIAYGTTPSLEHHASMRATGIVNFLDALSHMLGWPLSRYHWAAPLLWAPGAIACLWLLRIRGFSRTDLLMGGLLLWTALQAVAAAYGRGNGMFDAPSRYTDSMVPGMVANAWFAARLWELAGGSASKALRAGAGVVGLLFVAAFFGGHVQRFPDDVAAMRDRHAHGLLQIANVRAYLETGDAAVLDKPRLHIPYPVASRLRELLDDPVLRKALVDGGSVGTVPALPPPASATAPAPATPR